MESADTVQSRGDDAPVAVDRIHGDDTLIAEDGCHLRTPFIDEIATARLGEPALVGWRAPRQLDGRCGKVRIARPALGIGAPILDEHFERLGLRLEQGRQTLSAKVAERALDTHMHPECAGREEREEREHSQDSPQACRNEPRREAGCERGGRRELRVATEVEGGDVVTPSCYLQTKLDFEGSGGKADRRIRDGSDPVRSAE